MKQEFDIPVLRQMAMDIKNAVTPKSVTADMVGSMLLALVEGQSEIIGTLEREKVTVRVNAYDGTQRVSTATAKVYVDIFSVGGVPTEAMPRQELAVDENGEVSFEVYKGYQYALFSKIEGMGASFQFVYTAGQEERTINLWNMPVGIYVLGYASYENDTLGCSYRYVPLISEDYCSSFYDRDDIDMGYDLQGDEYLEDSLLYGILVSTADTSFVIEPKSESIDRLGWTNTRDFTHAVPTMPTICENPADFDGDWNLAADDAISRARTDFDGNLNTAKILSFCKEPFAANFCSNIEGNDLRQVFLPSAGQLYLMYLNKEAINTLMSAANADDFEFDLIQDPWHASWSSTQSDDINAWYIRVYSGEMNMTRKSNNFYVRAVSAFHFLY